MTTDKISLKNIKNIETLDISFEYPESNIIVITGRNGIGKTTLIKAFGLLHDPMIFQKSSGEGAINSDSIAHFELSDCHPFTFSYRNELNALDTRDKLPPTGTIISELPIPFGKRFQLLSVIARFDEELRTNISTTNYDSANELIKFLNDVYRSDKFSDLKATLAGRQIIYFLLKANDYYIREDHFSSGEYFLIQLFRLISSGGKLILIDELDVALDAVAQVNLYSAIKPILKQYGSRLIVVSHSLAFMSTVDDGGLYYLECESNSASLEQRSFGYIKSDLYGFKGKERFIITEDETLSDFINHLIHKHLTPFFEYEIIPVGGKPQIESIAKRNDSFCIFGPTEHVLIIVDKDIVTNIKYSGASTVISSPVDDIELFIWQNRNQLLSDIEHPSFPQANREKDKAKTFWKKLIRSNRKTKHDLFSIVEAQHPDETAKLIEHLRSLLCLNS